MLKKSNTNVIFVVLFFLTLFKRLFKGYRIAYILIIFILFYCSDNTRSVNSSRVEITDMLGRKVEIPVKIKKILAIRSGALRYVVYLDASDLVAGVKNMKKNVLRRILWLILN